jgi:hypothetical protein
MEYAYYITIEVRTHKALGTAQQEKLRGAVLAVLDNADPLPYVADIPTATIGGEEMLS